MATNVGVAPVASSDSAEVRADVMKEFRRRTGSALGGLFGGVAFDQVALPEVAAAVDRSGRFAENFSDRGFRGGLSAMLATWGDPADRAAEARWLKEQHKAVRGRGRGAYRDVRYSALKPENWKWIAVSGMMLSLNTFEFCTGIRMNAAEREVGYQMLREVFMDLELPSAAGKLPPTLADADSYYEEMVETKLASTPFLVEQFAGLTRLPMPTLGMKPLERVVMRPLWYALRPVVGRAIVVSCPRQCIRACRSSPGSACDRTTTSSSPSFVRSCSCPGRYFRTVSCYCHSLATGSSTRSW